jgi:tetratricopeptide (TPR) repeat protein
VTGTGDGLPPEVSNLGLHKVVSSLTKIINEGLSPERECLARCVRALAYMCLGKTEEMLLDADRALEISPSALYVRIARSFIYVTADRLEAAPGEIHAGLALSRADPEAAQQYIPMLFGLEGRVYVRMGERAKARESLLAAVTNGDRSGFTHNLLGLLELEAGEYSAALEHIKLACAVEPQSPDYSVWKENSRKAEETTIPSISRQRRTRCRKRRAARWLLGPNLGPSVPARSLSD